MSRVTCKFRWLLCHVLCYQKYQSNIFIGWRKHTLDMSRWMDVWMTFEDACSHQLRADAAEAGGVHQGDRRLQTPREDPNACIRMEIRHVRPYHTVLIRTNRQASAEP